MCIFGATPLYLGGIDFFHKKGKSSKFLVSLFSWFGFWPLNTKGLVRVMFLHGVSWPLAPPLPDPHCLCPVPGSSEQDITFRLLHPSLLSFQSLSILAQSKLPEISFTSCTSHPKPYLKTYRGSVLVMVWSLISTIGPCYVFASSSHL